MDEPEHSDSQETHEIGRKDRRRKKHFYAQIREQIEFYLGDINLSKDRFFASKLKESPYIEIELILNCNRVRKLTSNTADVVKALKKSDFLSITEDGTKIFRTTPFQPIENEDECTIYVEDLPKDIDHDWLRNVFSVYGEVVYVSLPRFHQTKKYKGFAFVQFKIPEGANNALKAFQKVNSCLSSSMPPTQLQSVSTYDGDKDYVVARHQPGLEDIQHISLSDNNAEGLKPTCGKDSELHITCSDDEDLRSEKRKFETVDDEVQENEEASFSKKKQKPALTSGEEAEEVPHMDGNLNESKDSTTMKQKKKKNRQKSKSDVIVTYGMQILSKRDWKKLRNKYLEEQKKRVREIKKQLWLAKGKNASDDDSSKAKNTTMENEEQISEVKEREPKFKFTPGVIAKITVDKPIKNIKSFKDNIRRNFSNVEYIDVSPNAMDAFIRCTDTESASNVVASTSNKWFDAYVLEGEEEQNYWQKALRDREEKLTKKIRCKVRGIDKINKKVEHIQLSNAVDHNTSSLTVPSQ